LRGKEDEYKRRDVEPLIVMAQQPFQLKRPMNLQAYSKWPKDIPAQVVFDPASTVSATYGVAFQTQFRDNAWSSRPTIFIIDRAGVIRYTDSQPNQDIRENKIFPALDNLE
jgi:alkyl hydroperoxide reductase subunit AhpC